MPNPTIYSVSISIQVQVIDLATALIEINRLYSPQANCAALSPVELYVQQGVNFSINPVGNANFLFVLNKASGNNNQALSLIYGADGVAPIGGQNVVLAPGAVFVFFDVAGTHWLNNLSLQNTLAGSSIPASIGVASING